MLGEEHFQIFKLIFYYFERRIYHSHENYYFCSWTDLLQHEFCIESETFKVTGTAKEVENNCPPHSSLTSSQLLPKPHFPLIPVCP
jgi:hypothetical protein